MSIQTDNPSAIPGAEAAVPVSSVTAPTGRRRSRLTVTLLLAVALLGGLAFYGLWSSAGDREPVVAVAQRVNAGETIESSDLTEAQVADDSALSPVSASELDDLVGQQAAVDLVPGSLVTSEQVTDQVVPEAGQAVVPLPVKPGQLPGTPLYPGDQVLVVDTPMENDSPPRTPPTPTEATVVGVVYDEVAGITVVDLAVDEADAPLLAARGQTGRVAVYLAGER
jgi:hypothetical protein